MISSGQPRLPWDTKVALPRDARRWNQSSLGQHGQSGQRRMPNLDQPASRQDRWAIYHIIRIHDEMVSEGYLKALIDDREATEPTKIHLDELAQKRRDIVDLELRVFKHLNSLGSPR